ncbi:CAP-associated domain-containing protein [Vallitaleaceae bacterium 9-2]
MKNTLFTLLLVSCLVCLQSNVSLGQESPSPWAHDEVFQAQELNLLDEHMMTRFQMEITREEFIELIIPLYEQMTNSQIDIERTQEFSDSNNPRVIRARALGIIYGTGDNRFYPKATITRQEMAVMLYRLLLKVDEDMVVQQSTSDATVLYEFTDMHTIDSWATDAVVFMYEQDIMTGDNRHRIKPLQKATKEEAIMLIYRSYLRFEDEITLGMSFEQLKVFLGEPTQSVASEYGFSWYLFASDYGRYLQAGVQDGIVVALYTESRLYSFVHAFLGEKVASTIKTENSDEDYIKIFYDQQRDDLAYGVLWIDKHANVPVNQKLDANQRQILGHSYEIQLYHLVNVARHKAGKFLVIWDEQAAKAAYLHSQEMAEYAYTSHTSIDGKRLEDRLKEQGITSSIHAENIASNQNAIFTHERLINTWRYRINILGDMTKIGIGTYIIEDTTDRIYHTQVFYE